MYHSKAQPRTEIATASAAIRPASADNATGPSFPRFNWILFVFIALGVTLRTGYLDCDSYSPDEQIAQAVVRNLSFPHQWDTNWVKTDVIDVFHYDQYNFSSYHYLLYFWNNLISLFGDGWTNNLAALRALNGLLGAAFIWLIAWTARRSIGEIAGIAAAAAAAIIPLLVQDAHYLRCEAMLTTGVTALLWLSTLPSSKKNWIFFTGGLIAGWMVASKATMGLALPLLLLLLISSPGAKSVNFMSLRIPSCLITLGLFLGIFTGVPWGVVQPHLYLSGLEKLALHYASPMPPYTQPDMAPSLLVTLSYMKGTLGWGFWAISTLGIVSFGRISGWWRPAILSAPLVAALVVFGGHAFFTERSYSPFFPLIILLFSAGTQCLINMFVQYSPNLRNYRATMLGLLLIITLALPTIYSWQIVTQGFSGRDQLEKDTALVQMRGNLKGKAILVIGSQFNAATYQKIATIRLTESLLVVVNDSYDAVTPSSIATMQSDFGAKILGVHESLFPDLPTCTLHTFVSPRLWLLYIPAR